MPQKVKNKSSRILRGRAFCRRPDSYGSNLKIIQRVYTIILFINAFITRHRSKRHLSRRTLIIGMYVMNKLSEHHVENEIDFRSGRLSVWRPVAAGTPFIKDCNPTYGPSHVL